MSASLVGSEMCIRDRRRAAKSMPTHQSSGASGGPRSAIGRRFAHNGAVSYTHLTLPTICSV
eukprot:2781394-Alexandrium_andersonii.AAC.1